LKMAKDRKRYDDLDQLVKDLAMNAGAWGFEIGERVIEVETLDPAGEVCVIHREALRFGCRSLGLPPDHIVVGALLEGEEADPVQLQVHLDEFQRRRRESQPLDKPSAGSVFKNPPGHSAGRLIEECGLKGARVGGARISPVHANFIVNEGGATAENILHLMTTVQERVHRRHGVKLEPEVRIVGEQEGR
jgi:UDP-N-acetylmuramate dehydrogenase